MSQNRIERGLGCSMMLKARPGCPRSTVMNAMHMPTAVIARNSPRMVIFPNTLKSWSNGYFLVTDELLAVFTKTAKVTGIASGKVGFSASSGSLHTLLDSPSLQADFLVHLNRDSYRLNS